MYAIIHKFHKLITTCQNCIILSASMNECLVSRIRILLQNGEPFWVEKRHGSPRSDFAMVGRQNYGLVFLIRIKVVYEKHSHASLPGFERGGGGKTLESTGVFLVHLADRRGICFVDVVDEVG